MTTGARRGEVSGLRWPQLDLESGVVVSEGPAPNGNVAVAAGSAGALMVRAARDGTLGHRMVLERGWADDRSAAGFGRMWVSMPAGPAGR